MANRINHQWRLAARPEGLIKESDFNWVEDAVPELQDGQILIRNLYLSLDPTMRMWATRDTYLPVVKIGEVMRGGTIGVVEESRNPKFKEGEHVTGLLGWQIFAVSDGKGLNVLPNLPGVP